jgi:protein MAK11
MGGLLENLGSINAIDSCKTHALTGTEQGKISIWRCKDWTNLHTLKGHRKPITAIALHPSDRLAISTGKDRRLYLWNLIKARAAYKVQMDVVLEEIHWSPCGQFFVARTGKEIRCYNVECNIKEEFLRYPHTSQLVSLGFLGRSDCIHAGDFSGEVILWKINRGTISFKAHTSRLFKTCYIESETRKILITITTLGELSIWNITSAVNSLLSLTKNSVLVIENPLDMQVYTTDLKCRCSSIVVNNG